MANGKTERRKLNSAERREFVFNLRKDGADYRSIARKTIERFGVENVPKGYDARYAYTDVKAVLDRLYKNTDSLAKDVRRMELERLDRLMLGIWSKARGGHLGAIDRVLRVMDRRAKLLGLDADGSTTEVNVIFDIDEWRTKRRERLDQVEGIHDE